jgi:pimeloyl-ACP methyl ester carboxylesterase
MTGPDRAICAVRDEFVTLDGLRFRYREWGDASAEPVVFLHGVLMYADPYDRIAERIGSTGRRVIVLDQRGHGQTDHADDYTWKSCEQDLERLWNELELRTVDVVAHSWGAEHACHLAAMRPDAIKRLVIFDNPLGVGLSAESPAFWAAAAELAPPDGFASREEFIELAQRSFPRAQPDALTLHSRGLVARNGRFHWQWGPDPAVFIAPGRNQPLDGMRQMCGRVRCPVLVVRSQHSELFASEDLERVVGSFVSASGAELPDSGHMVMWESPNGVADIAIGFLQSAA